MSWITFEPAGESKSGKTKLWNVVAKEGGEVLGIVSWYANWRRYVFSPQSLTSFEEDCLREIANFVETKTADHKRELKAAGAYLESNLR